MKNLYFFTAVILLLTAQLRAQTYDLEMVLESPLQGSSVMAGNTTFRFGVRNNGPDEVPYGTKLAFGYSYGSNEYYSLSGQFFAKTIVTLSNAIPAGATVPSTVYGTVVTRNTSQITAHTEICPSVNIDPIELTTDYNATNDYACFTVMKPSTASLEEVANASKTISCYPNPVKNMLNIQSAVAISVVLIVGMDGKTIAIHHEPSINLSNLVAGIYICEVRTENGITERNFFIKED